jgi:hypothetical protein
MPDERVINERRPDERSEEHSGALDIRSLLPDGWRELKVLDTLTPGTRPLTEDILSRLFPSTTGQKALIVLQENTGGGGIQYLPSWSPQWLNQAITGVIDKLAETFEDLKTQLQAAGRYDVVHLLTDAACTRADLLQTLIDEARKKRIVDLLVLGHGSSERLVLNQGELTPTTIASLLTDAQAQGLGSLSLRTVYMCNCYGSTLGNDWVGIGAKVAVGSKQNDWMPEPMITYFLHDYLAGKTVAKAAEDAYRATIPWYLPIYPPTVKITYSTYSVPYPCPTWSEPWRMCSQNIDVPSGVTFTPHSNVLESELLVIGDGSVTF